MWRDPNREPYEWAVRFERRIRESLLAADDDAVVGYETIGRDAQLAAPTPEHYLPLLYIAGSRSSGDPVSFPVEGFDGGSMSMLAIQIG
jgi:4,5-DOPA dioxygenase extradiol